ncbi:GNAT family N-acetyltransferase [Celerinatantimonas yamalensis]|uniref:GNAT family N-acetyltransferase n=1 Tax=Celerinatantimonas yamalensis TaxID=559956 RepID=A0ABW9G409_9GAMM
MQAAPELKQGIIADTHAHIGIGLSSPEHVFLKSVGPEGQILGYILLRNAWNLSDLFIDPKAQGRGLGKALFFAALSHVQARDHRGYIRVNSSLNAEAFYRKLGFESFTIDKPYPNYVVPLIHYL